MVVPYRLRTKHKLNYSSSPEKLQTSSLHLLTMAPPKLAAKSIDSTAADAAHAELSKYVESHTPGIVEKKLDTQPNFNRFLETIDLQKTNELVINFLDVSNTLKALVCLSGFYLTYEVIE
jgi:hypothetical protein